MKRKAVDDIDGRKKKKNKLTRPVEKYSGAGILFYRRDEKSKVQFLLGKANKPDEKKEETKLDLSHDKLVFIGGKREDIDGGFPVVTAVRECREELKEVVKIGVSELERSPRFRYNESGYIIFLHKLPMKFNVVKKFSKMRYGSKEISSLHWVDYDVLVMDKPSDQPPISTFVRKVITSIGYEELASASGHKLD